MLLNCGVGEDSWKSLGLQGDPTSPFLRRSALGFLWKEDAKAETPVLWPPNVKIWLIGKDSDAGRDWGQEDKETTEDEMAGWHHRLNGRESAWTPGVGDGQGGLACCDSWGGKETDMTEWLNWTELNWTSKMRSENWPLDLAMFRTAFGEGNGNPLQYSCLENPRDRGAWWVAICGVAQSRTCLTRLSSSSRTAFTLVTASAGME